MEKMKIKKRLKEIIVNSYSIIIGLAILALICIFMLFANCSEYYSSKEEEQTAYILELEQERAQYAKQNLLAACDDAFVIGQYPIESFMEAKQQEELNDVFYESLKENANSMKAMGELLALYANSDMIRDLLNRDSCNIAKKIDANIAVELPALKKDATSDEMWKYFGSMKEIAQKYEYSWGTNGNILLQIEELEKNFQEEIQKNSDMQQLIQELKDLCQKNQAFWPNW